MAIVIELQPNQQRLLEVEAQKRDLTLEQYASRILSGECPPPHELQALESVLPHAFTTGADIVAYWKEKGLIGTLFQDTEEDSLVIARRLRENAERRGWRQP